MVCPSIRANEGDSFKTQGCEAVAKWDFRQVGKSHRDALNVPMEATA